MPADGPPGSRLWPPGGWRRVLLSALAAYAVVMVVFLALGGAAPDSGMEAMEDEVVAAAALDRDDGESAALRCDEIDPAAAGRAATDAPIGAGGAVHQVGFTTLDGDAATLAAYAGCPLVVNFFASWCVPCVTEMPDFEKFWTRHGERVAVVGLAVEDAEPARAIVAETGVTYPVGVDDDDLLIELGGLGMPTTVFVSPGGDRLDTHSGILTFDDLTARAGRLFGLADYFDTASAAAPSRS